MSLTSESPVRTRPSYRPFVVKVARRQQLSPSFVQLTLTGDDLDQHGQTCLDRRIKLIFADTDVIDALASQLTEPDFDWLAWWREQDGPSPMRTYTVRGVRPEVHEVDIDFVCHGEVGPASRFALTCSEGDRLILVGPDSTVPESAQQGIAWRPGDARTLLLAGDETAAPAICGIVEQLPDDAIGRVFIEVPEAGDFGQLAAPAAVEVTWLARDREPHGAALTEAVMAWATGEVAAAADPGEEPTTDAIQPDGLVWDEPESTTHACELYAWLAGESGVITTLRRRLLSEVGLDRRSVAFMGYWKAGHAAAD